MGGAVPELRRPRTRFAAAGEIDMAGLAMVAGITKTQIEPQVHE
jgi:hypothetical protein